MENRNTHCIILLRGLPGSGKSSLAKVLSENGSYPVFSVDDFFTDAQGNYHFNHLDNHKAYDQCIGNAERSMSAGERKVFIDNTFTMDWEMEPYFLLAKKYKYDIFVVTVENYHGNKNIHDIPEIQIDKMRGKYKLRL